MQSSTGLVPKGSPKLIGPIGPVLDHIGRDRFRARSDLVPRQHWLHQYGFSTRESPGRLIGSGATAALVAPV